MVDPKLSRREILAGMAVTGTSGALVGSGTVSLFTDEETFANNSLTGSTSIAGTVEIDVTAESVNGKIKFIVELPKSGNGNGNLTVDNGTGQNETEALGTNNNPSHVWFRTEECPSPTQSANEIEVEVSIEECPGILASGTVSKVFTENGGFIDGELLACDDEDACLVPGESRTLVIEPTSIPSDTEPVKIALEVYAEQCRYNSDPVNPFDSSQTIDAKDCQ